jgi:hypothetical protein
MSTDPYAANKLDTKYPCADKIPVNGKLCVILDARASDRGLELADYPSRAVLKDEVHELILTAESIPGPGSKVNKIAYLGYFIVRASGVLWVGDQVLIGRREIGVLAGYDMTHFPNHMNIIIKTNGDIYTGLEAGFKLGAPVSFVFPGRPGNE